MESFFKLSPITIDQVISVFIALLVAGVGYRIHERMRLQHYFGELRDWSASCMDCLSEAVHLCDLSPQSTIDPSFYNRRHDVLVNLSSLIDQGRWFFPGVTPADPKSWQPDGYTNSKQRPLDDLVYAYGAVKQLSYKDQTENSLLKPPLVEIKKDFTLSIQILLDPKKAHKQFGLATKKSFVSSR